MKEYTHPSISKLLLGSLGLETESVVHHLHPSLTPILCCLAKFWVSCQGMSETIIYHKGSPVRLV
jgi:hypothetical protein